MTIYTKNAVDVFAPRTAGGVPRAVVNADAQVWGTEIQTVVAAALAGVGEVLGTWDASSGTFPGSGTADTGDAWIVTTAGTTGGVAFRVGDRIVSITTNSSTSTYAGNWLRLAGNIDPVVSATDSGAGTANAIQVVASKVVSASGGQLVAFNVHEANTGTTVTLQITDAAGAVISGLSVKTASGADPAVGALSAGLSILGQVEATTFRILSDLGAAADRAAVEAIAASFGDIEAAREDWEQAVTDAEAAQTAAETAETNAETAETAAESARDVALAALGSAGNYYTDTTLAAAQATAEGALSEGDTYAATGDDVGYVGVYEVTSGPDSTELWRVPTAAAVDVLADQAKQYENGSDDLESLSGRATIAQSTANIAEWSFDDATTSTIKFSRNSGSGAGGFVAVGTAIVDSIGETEVSAEFSLLSGTTTNAGAGFCFGSGNDRLYVYCTSGGVVARADKDATAVVIESANSVLAYIATEVFALSVAIAADRQSAALTVTGPDGDALTYSIATPIPAGPVFVAARLSSGAVMACSSFTWRGVVARLNDRIEAVAPEDAYVRVAGPVSTPATGSDNSASTFMYGDPIALTGELRVEIFGGTVGGIVYVKRFDAETRIQIGSDILVPGVRAAALRTFDTGVVVNAGECLGFHAPAGSVAFIGGSAESGGYLNNSGNVSTITDTSLSTNGQLQVRFSVRRDAHTRLDAADEKIASLTARGAAWIPVAGIDVPKVGAGTVAAGTYGFRDAVRVGGPLKIEGVGGPSDGTIRFRRMALSGDTFKQVGPDIVVTTVANTPFAHTSDDVIEVGQTLHWYVTASALAYSGGKGPRTGWVNSSGNVTSFTDASGSTTGAFELKVSVLAAPPRPCSATGKRIAVFGTSIEEYSDWPRQTGELIGADVMNFGIGGSRTSANYGVNPIIAYSLVPIAESIASGDWTTIKAAALAALTGGTDDVHRQVYQASEVDWSEVDAILLCYGTNDWSSETPLGTSASITDDGTFYGALNYSIEIIQEAFPNIQIVLATPLWRTAPADADTNANGAGVFLSEYVDVVLDVARAHKLPVLDAYRESGINKFNHAAYLDDGTHPTAAGF